MHDRVIVTAVSQNMWNDYLVFYDSIRRLHDYHIYLICLEMLPWQLETLKKHKFVNPITVCTDQIEDYKKTDNHWRQWFKPFYLKMIPEHETILWLDIDIVILDDLDPVFQHAERQFLVVADYFAPKTCVNNPELYKKFKLYVPKEKTHIVLNSGVLGYQPKRDKEILKLWRRKIEIATADEKVKCLIALYDQGALLWAMQELNMCNYVVAKKAWNHPAKKNPYELASKSIDSINVSGVKCPLDIIDNVKIDNPNTVIAHFAGLPKLTHLCEPDHVYSRTRYHQKNSGREIRRIFITGLERSGLRTVAEIFRQATTSESWIRYDIQPTLAWEVQAQHHGLNYRTSEFLSRLDLYARQDCGLICEANKNIAFFTKEIYKRLNGAAKFIVLLRDPVSLIRSRLLNYVVWLDELYTTPSHYQAEYRESLKLGRDTTNNYFRCKPHTAKKHNIIDLHIWEIEHTLSRLVNDLRNLPSTAYKFIWLENIRVDMDNLIRFSGGTKLNPEAANKCSAQKHGYSLKISSQSTIDWIEDELNNRMLEIYERMGRVMNEYNITVPYAGI